MENNEDYLDGLLDSITQVKTEGKSNERRSRDRRRNSGRHRRNVGADEDFMEVRGLEGSKGSSFEDDFLSDLDDELSMDDADDLIRSFERELDGSLDPDDGLEDDDYFDLDADGISGEDNVKTDQDAPGARSILDNIAGIVSEAKRFTGSDQGGEDDIPDDTSGEIQVDEPDGDIDEPVLSEDMTEERPMLDESGEDVDLMDMLKEEDGEDLSEINELLDAEENGDELEAAREVYEGAAEEAASGEEEGGEASDEEKEDGEEGESEEGEDGPKEASGGEETGGDAEGSGGDDAAEEGEEEKKPSLIEKILGIFKKKEPAEGEEDDEDEDEEDGDGKESAEEKKARKKAEKEEKAKKKKEEAEAKKKAKAEEKKAKEAEKKAKAAAKAAKPKKPKKKKKKERSPKIPIPVFVVFTLLGISIIASINIMSGVVSYRAIISDAHKAYDKKDYTVAYRILAGRSDLTDEDDDLRKKAKVMAFMQLKSQQYRILMNSGTQLDTGVDNYNIRTNYQMALDSLISAVYYYKKNEGTANELGITEEYMEYGIELEKELSNQFGMTSGDATDLYHKENRKDYTKALQEIIKENGLTEKK